MFLGHPTPRSYHQLSFPARFIFSTQFTSIPTREKSLLQFPDVWVKQMLKSWWHEKFISVCTTYHSSYHGKTIVIYINIKSFYSNFQGFKLQKHYFPNSTWFFFGVGGGGVGVKEGRFICFICLLVSLPNFTTFWILDSVTQWHSCTFHPPSLFIILRQYHLLYKYL